MAATSQPSAGGVWKRTDRNGREYFYFQVEVNGLKYSYRAFLNNNKTSDKQPDYRLFPVDDGIPIKKWEPKPKAEIKPEERKVTAPPAPAYEQAPEGDWKDAYDKDTEDDNDGLPAPEKADEDPDLPF